MNRDTNSATRPTSEGTIYHEHMIMAFYTTPSTRVVLPVTAFSAPRTAYDLRGGGGGGGTRAQHIFRRCRFIHLAFSVFCNTSTAARTSAVRGRNEMDPSTSSSRAPEPNDGPSLPSLADAAIAAIVVDPCPLFFAGEAFAGQGFAVALETGADAGLRLFGVKLWAM